MPERAPTVSPSAPGLESAGGRPPPTRNRRTAIVLVAWILILMLASTLVAWFRN